MYVQIDVFRTNNGAGFIQWDDIDPDSYYEFSSTLGGHECSGTGCSGYVTSSGTITANTATTVTATLSGGTDNDWDTSDVWVIGCIGVNVDANSGSVVAICDFFNNTDGYFVVDSSSTAIGHMYKAKESGPIYPNGKLQLGTSGSGEASIELVRSGTVLGRLVPGTTGTLALQDAGGTEIILWDADNGIIDINKSTGRLRLISGAYIEYFQGGVSVIDAMGNGSPEGVLTANPGSTYRNRAGGAGTSFYVKESGVGNTGWVGK